MQVVPLIWPIPSYVPQHSHFHSDLSLPRLQLFHDCITQTYVIPLFLSIPCAWVDTEDSIHWLHHTPSTAYTKNSIHRVQHTPSTAYIMYNIHPRLFYSLHSHDYELTPEYCFSIWCDSRHYQPPSASFSWELNCKVNLSHSHSCKLTNWWIKSQCLARCPSITSKYSSNLAQSQPASTLPNSLNHGLRVHIQIQSITASKLARLQPLKFILTLAQSWPPSLHDHSLQEHLHTRSIEALECISKFTQSWSPNLLNHGLPSVCPNSLHYGYQVHLWVHSIFIFMGTSNCSRALPAASPDILCVDG